MSHIIQFINFADSSFRIHQQFALQMARFKGGFSSVKGFRKEDIDTTFYKKFRTILDLPRGCGYWLWKPYIVNSALSELNTGDYLFYSDAGVFFRKPVSELIIELSKHEQDIMGFELPLLEYQWTKMETFLRMGLEYENIANSNQILASFFLVRKSNYSVKFFAEYLKYCCDKSNLTDVPLDAGSQHSDFIKHRHDQSIFSLLYKRYGLKPFKDPSQFGDCPWLYADNRLARECTHGIVHVLSNGRHYRPYVYTNKYKDVLFHHRSEDPIKSFVKYNLKKIIYGFC